ncbi:MAG: glycine--tRNA ligase subunit beta [Deinococcales bacterium]
MAELIFEIGTEELPSWYLFTARDGALGLMSQALTEAQLSFEGLKGYITPRRIAVAVSGLAIRSAKRFEKKRGPALQVAFEQDGSYSKATLGFAESLGISPERLQKEESDKGSYLIAYVEQGGELAIKLLPAILQHILESLPAPRKMRWGLELSFIRPVIWLLALLDDEVIPLKQGILSSGRYSYGHRFLAPEAILLSHASDYVKRLESAYVIPDFDERRKATWQSVMRLSQDKGLIPSYDDNLLAEVTNLIEYPFAILGNFDTEHLSLPEEVLSTVMMSHQRFFPIRHPSGDLAPHFEAVVNNKVEAEKVKTSFEKVLAGRLYDAQFFWRSDCRKSLSQHAWSLSEINFEKDLGSFADQISRVTDTALWLAEKLKLSEAENRQLDGALPIFKADLATQMVDEYPELEGIMGREYALSEGQPKDIAELLEQGIRPRGSSDKVPDVRVGAILAVADRMDKLLGFFSVGKRPSGSNDPFGLRRDGAALARALNSQGWQLRLADLANIAAKSYEFNGIIISAETQAKVVEYVLDRVATLLADEGINANIFKAASADQAPVIRIARRCHVLKQLSQIEPFNDLIRLYKRAANLASEADDSEVRPRLFESTYESELFESVIISKQNLSELFEWVRSTLSPWDLGKGPKQKLDELESYLTPVLQMKAPLDAFLDHILVKVDQEKLRRNRLALLREVKQSLIVLGALDLLN